MKCKFFAPFAILTALAYTQAYADTTYDAKSVVSESQLNTIMTTILKIAPSGTKVSNLDFAGFFTVDDDRYMKLLDVTSVKFKVSTKVGIIPLSSDVTLSMAGTFPDSDCNNPKVTRVTVDGNSIWLDGPIRDHVNKNKVSIFKDNFVAQTDLIKYCKVKPVSTQVNYEPLEIVISPEEYANYFFNTNHPEA